MIMKTLFIPLLVLASIVPAWAEPSTIRQAGECKIVRAEFNEPGVIKVPLKNSDVEILAKFRADDFFGRDVVMANPEIKNLSGKDLNVAYHVAFFSKEGELIGSATQEGDVKADAKNHQFGSCIVTIPPAEIAKINSYKVVVYVKEAKPKK
jgi:hypothetical protein